MVEQNDSAEPDFGATFALAAGAFEPEAELPEGKLEVTAPEPAPTAVSLEVSAAKPTAPESKASETPAQDTDQPAAQPDVTTPHAALQETQLQETAKTEPAAAATTSQEVPEFAIAETPESVIASPEVIAPELSAPEPKAVLAAAPEASVLEITATPGAPELTLEAITEELNGPQVTVSDTASAEAMWLEASPQQASEVAFEREAIAPQWEVIAPQSESVAPQIEATAPQPEARVAETTVPEAPAPAATKAAGSAAEVAAPQPESPAPQPKVTARQWTAPEATASTTTPTKAAAPEAASKTENKLASRPFRVKLRGSVLVLVRLPNRRDVRAAIHQLSTSGGVIHLEKPLDEKIVVEMIFHIGGTTVREKAQMLFPMWATQGWMQPFRFTNLSEADRIALDGHLKGFLGDAAKGAAAGS